MVYIDRDGRVVEKRPWDLNRVIGIFTGLWFLLLHFVTSLIAPFRSENRGGNRSSDRSGGWGSGGSGGGGGGGGSGGNGGFGPNRRIGRITNSMDHNVPGGCPGGGCGR